MKNLNFIFKFVANINERLEIFATPLFCPNILIAYDLN